MPEFEFTENSIKKKFKEYDRKISDLESEIQRLKEKDRSIEDKIRMINR